MNRSRRSGEQQTALFCLLPGLGDALVASVAMRKLDERGWRVEVLAMLEPVAEYASALLGSDRVTFAPLLKDVPQSFPKLLELRRRRFDAVYVPFPATRWQYAAVAALVNGNNTFIHRYGGLSSLLARIAGSTQTALRGGHRVFENLRLVGLEEGEVEDGYWLPEAWRRPRVSGLFGVHVGTMAYKGNEARRWPVAKFRAVIDAISSSHPTRLFFGPHEEAEFLYFNELNLPNVTLVRVPLPAAALSVSECEVFLTNDNGFAHLASGLGVKTLTLFGMTNPVRALPLGDSVPVRASACPPCHDEGLRAFDCVLGIDYCCVKRDLTVSYVANAVRSAFLRQENRSSQLSPSGPYRLYGRVRT